MGIESFLKERLFPVYKAYYALWVYYWPLWRRYTGRGILRKWQEYNLVEDGQTFLDYGCGTGDFTIPAARKVSEQGKVYALDCFRPQLERVLDRAEKAGLNNVETILSTRETGLTDESIDVIWICDVLHEISRRRPVLEELHRVLKQDGVLVIYDGMRKKILDYTGGLFSLTGRSGKFLKFVKIT
ncbi:MAG: class I SAM-dependent methyltransferase [Dehalococcoidales bacterium]|nr:class I SAM-dependent methyltransferase [Dehalococcoidales bacterium]MDZ4230791.1 class I SAM-dependent methyltransferase [Dehalococcoidales bacterium]